MTQIAVHVDDNGNLDGGYATIYGECNPEDGWYEVTMDPLMDLDCIQEYKIEGSCLVLKDTEKTNFDTAIAGFNDIKKITSQQQQISLDAISSQNQMLHSVTQGQQVDKEILDLINSQAQSIASLQDQIKKLSK